MALVSHCRHSRCNSSVEDQRIADAMKSDAHTGLQVLKLVDRSTGAYVTNKYHYDLPQFPHYITSMENPLGIPVARDEYDDDGRLIAVVDADGNRTEFIHN